ncbi:glycosyltransferase family 20-domain-containing protein [Pisolithus marmoratus]|nr:glycosyltransferase family 20-domain-containing protein [Pisolithus marmoratus]
MCLGPPFLYTTTSSRPSLMPSPRLYLLGQIFLHKPWHIFPNTHCNGSLKNAVDSAKGRLPWRLWFYGFSLCNLFWPTPLLAHIVRVSDYHLMLLPGSLRSHLKAVGFQIANYARHFRQTAPHILAYESLPNSMQVEGPVAPVSTGGKAEKAWNESAEGKKTKEEGCFVEATLRRDEVDSGAGQAHQQASPEFQGPISEDYDLMIWLGTVKESHTAKVAELCQKLSATSVLTEVALQITKSNELTSGISDIVAHIDVALSTYTCQPVTLLVHEATFSQYLALLIVADAVMATSLRESIAPQTHEYIECQEERKGALILSKALIMSDEEATSHWQRLHNHVAQTTQAFVTSFLT